MAAAVATITRLQPGQQRNRGSIHGRKKQVFVFSKALRSALGLTQSPTQWMPGIFHAGENAAREGSWLFTSN